VDSNHMLKNFMNICPLVQKSWKKGHTTFSWYGALAKKEGSQVKGIPTFHPGWYSFFQSYKVKYAASANFMKTVQSDKTYWKTRHSVATQSCHQITAKLAMS
jgi:hypothetical protein